MQSIQVFMAARNAIHGVSRHPAHVRHLTLALVDILHYLLLELEVRLLVELHLLLQLLA